MALPELVMNSLTPGARVPLTTLSAAMTDTTGLSMSTLAAAPAALRAATGQFRVIVDSEIMLVAASAGGGSPWTILTRGAEGSTATTHLLGAQVWHYLTAGALAALSQGNLQLPTPKQLRHSCGIVTTAGAINWAGTADWTVARTGVGAYTVTNAAWPGSNAVVVTPLNATGGTGAVVANVNIVAGSFTVVTFASNTGANVDAYFSFMVDY